MNLQRKRGFYEKYIKRILDVVCSLLALILFSWLYLIIAVMVRLKMGKPILFKQPRPGMMNPRTGDEQIFSMYKFRTMTDERGSDGELLPDDQRLPKFGAWLRNTSLDELPEALNILKGDMSVVGQRPQLVRDMVFMTDRQRLRHTARPGLTGLAQVNGRNAIDWEEKFEWDLRYIEQVSFLNDLKIMWLTVKKALLGHEGVTEEGSATATDFGDYLLGKQMVTKAEYEEKQKAAKELLKGL